jgi:glycerophosphoryl diester phosphodiesterase
MSAPPRHPYLDVEGPIVMAHRGFSLDGLENTMTAFAAAVALGVTHVETDVHATRDGVLVAFHDRRIDRVTDRRGRIADLTWDELRSARVRGVEQIPRLDELLGSWPGLRVNIDVKDWPAVGPTAEVVTRAAALGRVCVTSFSDRRTAAVRERLGPGVATSAGPTGVLRWAATAAVAGPGPRRPGRTGRPHRRWWSPGPTEVALQVPATAGPIPVVTRRSVELAHQHGRQVHVWTIDDPTRMHRLLDLGVDGLITNRSDTLRDVLRARGQLPA